MPRCLLVEVLDPDKPIEQGNIQVICPPGLQAIVIKMYHTCGHWVIRKTVDAILRQKAWRSMYSHEAEFIIRHCPICVEKQKVDLKQGVHVPQVIHEQEKVVYVDLLGPFSNQVSCCE